FTSRIQHGSGPRPTSARALLSFEDPPTRRSSTLSYSLFVSNQGVHFSPTLARAKVANMTIGEKVGVITGSGYSPASSSMNPEMVPSTESSARCVGDIHAAERLERYNFPINIGINAALMLAVQSNQIPVQL
ncbi:hypothetical protein RSAG8_00748, partial [Rhizoctonia solani AG-8 WAC10335]